jgi:hypothetical protein
MNTSKNGHRCPLRAKIRFLGINNEVVVPCYVAVTTPEGFTLYDEDNEPIAAYAHSQAVICGMGVPSCQVQMPEEGEEGLITRQILSEVQLDEELGSIINGLKRSNGQWNGIAEVMIFLDKLTQTQRKEGKSGKKEEKGKTEEKKEEKTENKEKNNTEEQK